MKKSLFAGIAVLGLSFFAGSVYSADAEKFNGVLIDQKCGAGNLKKDDPEKAAAGHPAACCVKAACAKSGFMLISGKNGLKLDEAGAAKAAEYLAKEGASTKVTIEGTKDGDTLKVSSISAAK